MEKRVGEEEIKGLEEEIDSAVDRLFVDKKSGPTEKLSMEPTRSESYVDEKSSIVETLSMESPILEPSPEPLKAPVRESFSDPSPEPVKAPARESFSRPSPAPVKAPARESFSHPSPEPPPYAKLFEKMETQLLSLEWEITRENLGKTREEVLALRDVLNERPDINSVLNLMEKVLIRMIENEEDIAPPQIKFLLDCREAIKLLMKKDTSSEINTYKQLVFGGIGARFLCLEETRGKEPSSVGIEERGAREIPRVWEGQIEGILRKMAVFSERLDDILKTFEYHSSRSDEMPPPPPDEWMEKSLLPLDITIFRIEQKLFGIESRKVFKLFKLPNAYRDKISSQQRIRLKEFEIQMVDLKKIFSIESKGRRGLTAGRQGEIQILTVKENGKYRGLIVDQVLKKLSAEADISKDYGEHFLGMARWTYQEKPVKIPILNLKKI